MRSLVFCAHFHRLIKQNTSARTEKTETDRQTDRQTHTHTHTHTDTQSWIRTKGLLKMYFNLVLQAQKMISFINSLS